MPKWAHLPLILKPDGNGKLSKRDGDRLGFPVFAMNWTDPRTSELTKGFREIGFLPEAFVNLLALLGWNDGTDQEIFTMEELIEKFSIDRVHKGGARFDFEKAKWFNHEWIKRKDAQSLLPDVQQILQAKGIVVNDLELLEKVISLVKDRCTLLTDFYEQSKFFFETPKELDLGAIKPKWSADKEQFFVTAAGKFNLLESWTPQETETLFKNLAAEKNIKPGDVLLPLRIMLVGGKFGPGVFEIAAMIGKEETIHRIKQALGQLNK